MYCLHTWRHGLAWPLYLIDGTMQHILDLKLWEAMIHILQASMVTCPCFVLIKEACSMQSLHQEGVYKQGVSFLRNYNGTFLHVVVHILWILWKNPKIVVSWTIDEGFLPFMRLIGCATMACFLHTYVKFNSSHAILNVFWIVFLQTLARKHMSTHQ